MVSGLGQERSPVVLGSSMLQGRLHPKAAASEHRVASQQPSPLSASPVDGMPALRLWFPFKLQDDDWVRQRGGGVRVGSGSRGASAARSHLTAERRAVSAAGGADRKSVV